MKKITRIVCASALALAAASTAQAQSYVEGAYTPTTIKGDGESAKLKPAMLTGVLGYGLHPNLAVEGMLGLGVKKDTFVDGDGLNSFKYKSAYGIYLKPRYQVNQDLEVFARIGYAQSRTQISWNGGSMTDREGSGSWGFGGNYAIDKNLYLTASYMNFHKKDGIKINGFNLGAGYKF
jgi:outer membrane protein X